MRALNEDEKAVLQALTDEFISTSVIKIRSGFSSGVKNASTLAACLELERLELAECRRSGPSAMQRWRRAAGKMDRP